MCAFLEMNTRTCQCPSLHLPGTWNNGKMPESFTFSPCSKIFSPGLSHMGVMFIAIFRLLMVLGLLFAKASPSFHGAANYIL